MSCVTIGFCLVTWRTCYYLGRELNGDPRPVHLFDDLSSSENAPIRMRKPITSFPAIARVAFGDNGCVFLSSVLYFELFSCLSIFFVLLGDHLHVLFPSVSQSKHMTIVAGILTLPAAIVPICSRYICYRCCCVGCGTIRIGHVLYSGGQLCWE